MPIITQYNAKSKILTIKTPERFDFSSHKFFVEALQQILPTMNAIVVDLQHTEHLESSALGMLLVAREKAVDQQQQIRVINARPRVENVLRIAKFDRLFALA